MRLSFRTKLTRTAAASLRSIVRVPTVTACQRRTCARTHQKARQALRNALQGWCQQGDTQRIVATRGAMTGPGIELACLLAVTFAAPLACSLLYERGIELFLTCAIVLACPRRELEHCHPGAMLRNLNAVKQADPRAAALQVLQRLQLSDSCPQLSRSVHGSRAVSSKARLEAAEQHSNTLHQVAGQPADLRTESACSMQAACNVCCF